MEDEYFKYLPGWVAMVNNLSHGIRETVYGLDDEWFGCGKEHVEKARTFEIQARLDKVIQPYNFYRDRMLDQDKSDSVVFHPAGEKPEKQKTLKWGQCGTAVKSGDEFNIKYLDGRGTATVKMDACREKKNAGGTYYSCRINETPTNIFPKDGTGSWSVHEYAMTEE
jgi:hypothetical protein